MAQRYRYRRIEFMVGIGGEVKPVILLQLLRAENSVWFRDTFAIPHVRVPAAGGNLHISISNWRTSAIFV